MTCQRLQAVQPGTRHVLASLEARIMQERGRISPLYQVLLNAPEIAKGWESLLSAIRNRNSLDPALREMIILRVAVLNRADYEFDAHVPHAIEAGINEQKIQALKQLDLPYALPEFSEKERDVLKLTDVMTREIQVSDKVYAPLKTQFNNQQILELVTTVSAYNMVSRLLNALQIGH